MSLALLLGSVGTVAGVAAAPAQAAATMTLAQFVSAHNGQYLDYPAGHGGAQYQCVDVFKAYDVQVVGGTGPAPAYPYGADDYWYYFSASLATRYTKVAPTQAAQPGDVAVWSGGPGGYGHMAIVLNAAVGSAGSLYVLTQNPGPVHEETEYKTQSYQGVAEHLLGFLRPTQSATQPVPAPAPAPGVYHTGKQVKVASQATGGDSGHTGPNNDYRAGPLRSPNSPLWIVCYVNGQQIKGPYDQTPMWDLATDGYYYSDAWLYTGTNGAAVPPCHLKTVTVASQATGGLTGHAGPGNQYTASTANHAKSTPITIACYVTGQSIKGPYDTTTIWDLATDGWYYTDAWLYTGTNGPAVPHC